MRCPTSLFLLLAAAALFAACGGPEKPLDADTRRLIDSVATAQIQKLRAEMDSACARKHHTDLPQLIDSIRRKRMEEIREQLKTVPKGI